MHGRLGAGVAVDSVEVRQVTPIERMFWFCVAVLLEGLGPLRGEA